MRRPGAALIAVRAFDAVKVYLPFMLLQGGFASRLPVATMRAVLQGYRGRFAALRDSVTETEPTFREDLLLDLDVVTLLTEPVTDLAERWRSSSAS